MIFSETELKGAFIVDLDRRGDERGFFTRAWCQREFAEQGLDPRLVQCNISFSERRGTLRGLHFQAPPHGEAKLVRCIRGSLYDVIVDLRPDSPTFCRWLGLELTAASGRAVYVPESFAHGFQTLEDGTEVSYGMSEFYEPAAARGVRWDDPAFGIDWPDVDERLISERDRTWPDFEPSFTASA